MKTMAASNIMPTACDYVGAEDDSKNLIINGGADCAGATADNDDEDDAMLAVACMALVSTGTPPEFKRHGFTTARLLQ